jgi:hypothetical protein
MDSVNCLVFYVCGESFGQENIKEHTVGACSPVMCVAWRDIKSHKVGCVFCCVVYLVISTHHNDMDAHWYGAKSITRKETEERKGYKK